MVFSVFFSPNADAPWPNKVAFSPDSELLITSSDDHTARLWDVVHGDCLEAIGCGFDPVESTDINWDEHNSGNSKNHF